MNDERNLNLLLANLINENSFAHCRICLKEIKDEEFVRFEDNVCSDGEIFLSLSEIVKPLANDETIFEEIPGIDVVCKTCADEAVVAYFFIQKCLKSTHLLDKVIDDVAVKLNCAIVATTSQNIYVHISEQGSQVVIHEKPLKEDFQKKSSDYKCDECKEKFKSVTELSTHNKTFHSISTCKECLEKFDSNTLLSSHVARKLKCPECNQYKCNEQLLKKHKEKVHTACVCKECGKTYQNIKRLREHKQKHHQTHSCPKCKKLYTTYNFYQKHVELCLSNKIDPHPMRSQFAKDFVCKECGKGYSTPGSLRVHERFAHSGEKGYECKICKKVFTAPSSLKLHFVTHTRERNFKCDLCQKGFVSKEALLYHKRRHTGEKPYQCTLCPERFVNASARAEHIKYKHVGPTLECDICFRKCVTSHYLKLHRSRHFDQNSKLFAARASVPASLPRPENIRNLQAFNRSLT